MTPIKLTDMRVYESDIRADRGFATPDGVRVSGKYRKPTEPEVLSACTTEGLLAEARQRGALVIVREDGNWPGWALDAIRDESVKWFDDNWHGLADESSDLLDALAEAAKETT